MAVQEVKEKHASFNDMTTSFTYQQQYIGFYYIYWHIPLSVFSNLAYK